MIGKIKPIASIYKKPDMNREDRRKFIKLIFTSWKNKQKNLLMENQTINVAYTSERPSYSVWDKNGSSKVNFYI